MMIPTVKNRKALNHLPTTRPRTHRFFGSMPGVWDSGLHSSGHPGPDARWLLAQNLVSILRRAGTADPAEHPREVLLRFESARHGDIKNPHLGLAQHLLFTLRQPFTVPNENSMWRTDWSSMR